MKSFRNLNYFLVLLLLNLSNFIQAQLPAYKNSLLPINQRVSDLLSRMTPEEKFRQLFMIPGELGTDSMQYYAGLFGFQINTVQQSVQANNQMMTYSGGQNAKATLDKINAMQRFFVNHSRLGIPMIPFDEALHGLVRTGATSFPQSIGMAASFDTILMNQVSDAIALEVKARGLRMILSPVINIATDVRWGRVEETYGEDPFLSSLFGVSYVRAMESRGIITTPKHFLANHGDGGRDSYPVFFSDRYLKEAYLKPFEAVIQKAGARSLMTAYNTLNGRPCSSNGHLLNDLLRKDLGFKGFVISDAGAVGGANVLHFTTKEYPESAKQSVENGLDVIFQTDIAHEKLFNPPFLDGSLSKPALDTAVARVLRAKFDIALFDNPYVSDSLLQSLNMNKHRQLAYEMAVKSVVLLKNNQHVLPLSKDCKRIAVIGPDAVEARLGGYSGPGNEPVSILSGLIQAAEPDVKVEYQLGCERVEPTFKPIQKEVLFHYEGNELKSGLKAAYFNTADWSGAPTFERVDEQINFQWTLFSPDPRLAYDHFGVKWEGVVVPDKSGLFQIGIDGNDGYRLFLNDALLIDRSSDQSYHVTTKSVLFTKGEKIKIRIEYAEKAGNSFFKLVWNAVVPQTGDKHMERAEKLAKKSDVVIAVVGIEEGEFRDRSSLKLPGRQEELIKRLAATGKPIIVVLVGGSAITMDSWIEEVDGIVDVWYPGEMGGVAVADILLGKQNPSGRLPITFPKSEGQLPLVYNHFPTGRGDDYNDGSGQALFPFGFGLSYTQFEYGKLEVDKRTFTKDEKVTIRFTVRNTGTLAGEEVVQLYTHDEIASLARPIKELKGFQRVFLVPGEEKVLTFALDASMLSFPNEALKFITEPGMFRIMIGASSKDIRLRTLIEYQ